jgi:hypothetical protein
MKKKSAKFGVDRRAMSLPHKGGAMLEAANSHNQGLPNSPRSEFRGIEESKKAGIARTTSGRQEAAIATIAQATGRMARGRLKRLLTKAISRKASETEAVPRKGA